MRRLVVFDLDETLVVEAAAAEAPFEAAARVADQHHAVDVARLAVAARGHARQLWRAAPVHDYCLRVGISSWEGLWCQFAGHHPALGWLRGWAPTYRRTAWQRALEDQGITDAELAEELAERFISERRGRHQIYPDVAPVISTLAATYELAVVTNGASCLRFGTASLRSPRARRTFQEAAAAR